MLMATFRIVLKVARDDGLIDVVPATPRQRQKDNPRAFFRFAPLVAEDRDEYPMLLKGATQIVCVWRSRNCPRKPVPPLAWQPIALVSPIRGTLALALLLCRGTEIRFIVGVVCWLFSQRQPSQTNAVMRIWACFPAAHALPTPQ